MRSIEIQGKTVDEAIFRGLDEMGLSIDEVDIEVLEEGGKRFLGMGNKQCRIRLTQRDKASIEKTAPAQEQKSQPTQHEAEEPEPPVLETRPQLKGEHIAPKPSRSADRSPKQRSSKSRGRSRNRSQHPQEQPSIHWGEPVDGGMEAEFLRGMLTKMGLIYQIDCFEDEQCLYMRVSGESMGVLIGRRGETLNALQYLTSLVANRGEGPYKRIIVDTENYRRKREDTLRRLARRKAEQVRKSGKPLSLEPMNPYERRVLHATLQGNPDVETHSEGEEPRRHVIISLK